MLASTLQLNTIISAQNNYLLYNNKLTRVIYLTYAIVLAKIITTALMASIKGNMLLGKYPWLVRHSNIIFRATRLAALLSSSFLVPILAVHTDNLTGQVRSSMVMTLPGGDAPWIPYCLYQTNERWSWSSSTVSNTNTATCTMLLGLAT